MAAIIRQGPRCGAVTSSSVTVGYTLTGVTTARLVVSPSGDLSGPVRCPPVPVTPDGTVLLTVPGLTARTRYFYGVEADGTVLPTGRGEVRTFPAEGRPASFSLAFGSCQATTYTGSVYTSILGRTGPTGRALMIVHMGDLHYRNWSASATPAQILEQHTASLGSPGMAPALARIPLSYLWDNHDWGGDHSDRDAPAGPHVAAVYRKVFPHYPLPASDGRAGYQTWVIGRCRFIQLDVRACRDPQTTANGPGKTMLGAEQKAWLKAQLLTPEPVKILCGNYPLRSGGSSTGGRWGSYPDEYNDLLAAVRTRMVGGLYVIFGDKHYLAADDGSSASAHGIPQAGGAPFQKTNTNPGEPWSQGSYAPAGVLEAYGWLDVTDTGGRITVGYRGITAPDDTTRVAMTTVFQAPVSIDQAQEE